VLTPLDNYFFQLPEPQKSCLLFLRSYFLSFSPDITEHYKYSTAFFHFKGKGLCYFSVRKKDGQAYIGFLEGPHLKHPALVSENRSYVKVYYLDVTRDLDIKTINALLVLAIKIAAKRA
jgi:hypothetical protein